jgi:murein DD-endopeptidase MepM/ murein hydrolase activator NlpD
LPRKPMVLVAIAFSAVLGLVADLGWRAYTSPKYAVMVNGLMLGALQEPEEATAALATVEAQIPNEMKAHIDLAAKLEVRPLEKNESRRVMASAFDIEQALVQTIPALTYASAITVNGQDVVAVANNEAAKQVRDTILDEYRTTVLGDADAVEQLAFAETIDWHPKVIPSERVRSVEEAISLLKHGTDKVVTYQVKPGDTGWDIARSYNVSTEQLADANPDVNMENLQIDQVLNVTFKEPYVHTQSVSKREVQEAIPFTEQVEMDSSLWPWQYVVVKAGVPGSRKLTIREYRENGRVVKTEVVENQVLSEPKVQIARTGTRQVPAMGSGSMVFPVVGTLTSYYGPRWGSTHTGIDIGAPSGTPVLAADDGMVVFAGWSGNYGYLVKVDHGEGRTVTWYGHLSKFNVAVGDTVSKGEVIAYVGNTGFSTGPHLHYEVRLDGTSVNPLNFYK